MNETASSAGSLALRIGIPGFDYSDLYKPARLAELTGLFHDSVRASDPELWESFDRYRQSLGEGMTPEEISDVVVRTAPYLSAFISELFQVQDEHGRWRRAVDDESIVFVFKREFVTRRALKRYPNIQQIAIAEVREGVDALNRLAFGETFQALDAERATATIVVNLLNLEKSVKGTEPTGALLTELSALIASVASAGLSLGFVPE